MAELPEQVVAEVDAITGFDNIDILPTAVFLHPVVAVPVTVYVVFVVGVEDIVDVVTPVLHE